MHIANSLRFLREAAFVAIRYGQPPPGTLGSCHGGRNVCLITVDPREDPALVQVTLLHELLHAADMLSARARGETRLAETEVERIALVLAKLLAELGWLPSGYSAAQIATAERHIASLSGGGVIAPFNQNRPPRHGIRGRQRYELR